MSAALPAAASICARVPRLDRRVALALVTILATTAAAAAELSKLVEEIAALFNPSLAPQNRSAGPDISECL